MIRSERPYFFNYWAKAVKEEEGGKLRAPCHLLIYHSLDVAAVCSVLLEHDRLLLRRLSSILNLSPQDTISLSSFLVSIHDIGKLSCTFQCLRPDLLQLLQSRTCGSTHFERHTNLGLLAWDEHIFPLAWRDGWIRPSGVSEELRQMRFWRRVLGSLMHAVTGHHGWPPSTDGLHGLGLSIKDHFTQTDLDASVAFVSALLHLFRGGHLSLDFQSNIKERFRIASWLLAGVAVLSDWIGSNASYFSFHSEPMSLKEYWQGYALPQAVKAVKEAGVLPCCPSSRSGINALFSSVIKIPSPLQCFAESCQLGSGPQLFILEDMTGSGKTEAAVVLAHRLLAEQGAEGVFFALPTMATANGMYPRISKTYRLLFEDSSEPSLVLAHSARHLFGALRSSFEGMAGSQESECETREEETASAQCAAWLADSRKKSLLASIGVGTIDQALLGILPSKHQSLRLLGIARSVLIVDEVHAYDAYMLTLLESLLNFHATFGGSAILLSATLPIKIREELAGAFRAGLTAESAQLKETSYPLATSVSTKSVVETPIDVRAGLQRTVSLKFVHDEKTVYDALIQFCHEGRCSCWIRNSVDDATDAYKKLVGILGNDRTWLFHARFALGDRLDIEQRVLKHFGKQSSSLTRSGIVLIATQVVEQSLDLDFDLIVSDLAPIDLLIQRMGRQHRHPRKPNGDPVDDGVDGRAGDPFYIFSPVPADDPTKDWYRSFFPRGAYVYPHHGQLWLTARLLAEAKTICLPEDLRRLVEGVYGNDPNIPRNLTRASLEAEGMDHARIIQGKMNALKLEQGYCKSYEQWLDDTVTPTRLEGEPGVTLRLARCVGDGILPWYEAGEWSWELSQVDVRQSIISNVHLHSKFQREIERVLTSMKDKGKWSILVPLSAAGDGVWQASGSDRQGRKKRVLYSPSMGLIVE